MKQPSLFAEPPARARPEYGNVDAGFIIRAATAIGRLAALGMEFSRANVWAALGMEPVTGDLDRILWNAVEFGTLEQLEPGVWRGHATTAIRFHGTGGVASGTDG